MKAMHGFAGPSRKRGRLIGCCTAAALLVSALAFAVPAGAVAPPPVTTYMALGDSLAFGYTAVKKAENAPTGDAPTFYEEGYVNDYAKKVRANTLKPNKGLVIVNYGCPGETTGGLLGLPEPYTCGYQKAGLSLHSGYVGHSQLEAALGLLKQKNAITSTTPAHPIEVVSLNIGGNDELAAVAACEHEVGVEEAGVTVTASVKENSTVMKEVSAYTDIRAGSHISGNGLPAGEKVAKLSEAEEGAGVLTMSLKAIGTETGGTYHFFGSSQYGETPEKAVAGCIASHAPALFEKIVKHIVETMGALDSIGGYTGPIVFNGFYNPDSFLLPGSDVLTAVLNNEAEKGISENIPNAVYANPFPTINPQPKEGAEETAATKAKEQAAICKYTEMCNPVAQSVHEAEVGHALPPNDGDIHLTQAGNELTATLMYAKAPV